MPLETPPWRVKNPWRMPPQLSSLEAQNMALSGVTMPITKIERNDPVRKEGVTRVQRW
jgi:hypothetical protein